MLKKLSIICFLVLVTACQSNDFTNSELINPGSQADLSANVGDFVLFGTNSSSLDEAGRNTLKHQAEWLKEYQEINVIIEGHCDERGTREYNLALGARRASSVRDFLVASGVNANRISIISFGKDKPAILGSGPTVWEQNRRAVTVVNN